MPRVKEFDEGEVLEHALQLFRVRGFANTSFADLTSELGVSRQSLYDTYGDKQSLYRAALKRYVDRTLDYLRRAFDQPAPVRDVLRQLFEATVVSSCSGEQAGCFMVNSMVERARDDADTRAFAEAYARGIEGVLVSRLSRAQRDGEIPADKDPVALARFFFNQVLAATVAIRVFGDPAAVRQSLQVALRALD